MYKLYSNAHTLLLTLLSYSFYLLFFLIIPFFLLFLLSLLSFSISLILNVPCDANNIQKFRMYSTALIFLLKLKFADRSLSLPLSRFVAFGVFHICQVQRMRQSCRYAICADFLLPWYIICSTWSHMDFLIRLFVISLHCLIFLRGFFHCTYLSLSLYIAFSTLLKYILLRFFSMYVCIWIWTFCALHARWHILIKTKNMESVACENHAHKQSRTHIHSIRLASAEITNFPLFFVHYWLLPVRQFVFSHKTMKIKRRTYRPSTCEWVSNVCCWLVQNFAARSDSIYFFSQHWRQFKHIF